MLFNKRSNPFKTSFFFRKPPRFLSKWLIIAYLEKRICENKILCSASEPLSPVRTVPLETKSVQILLLQSDQIHYFPEIFIGIFFWAKTKRDFFVSFRHKISQGRSLQGFSYSTNFFHLFFQKKSNPKVYSQTRKLKSFFPKFSFTSEKSENHQS